MATSGRNSSIGRSAAVQNLRFCFFRCLRQRKMCGLRRIFRLAVGLPPTVSRRPLCLLCRHLPFQGRNFYNKRQHTVKLILAYSFPLPTAPPPPSMCRRHISSTVRRISFIICRRHISFIRRTAANTLLPSAYDKIQLSLPLPSSCAATFLGEEGFQKSLLLE